MSLTKRQIIDDAFAEFGLSPEFFDLTPGQYQQALQKLDLMIGNWQNNAIRIAYTMPYPVGSGNLNDDSGIPDVSLNAVILGLAMQLAPRFGKQVSAETKQNFKDAYDNLVQNAVAEIPEIQKPQTLSRGAGNKYWRVGTRSPFYPIPDPVTTDGAESAIEALPSFAQTTEQT